MVARLDVAERVVRRVKLALRVRLPVCVSFHGRGNCSLKELLGKAKNTLLPGHSVANAALALEF